MKMKLHNKNFKALLITLSIIIVLSIFSSFGGSVVSSAVSFLTKGLFQVTALAAASPDTPSAQELEKENARLRQENAELREQLVDYYDLKAENDRLNSYYGLKKQNPSYEIVPASVIMRDANDDFYSFTLDAGSTLGVKVNDPVITENGLVGWVYRVDAVSCKVKTILSPDTKAAALDKQSSDSAVVSGSAGLCDDNLTRLDKLAENHRVKQGDIIVTSGTGGVYPPNLIIGKVRETGFNKYDSSRYAIIEPYEDIRRVTAAAVITDFDTKGKVERQK